MEPPFDDGYNDDSSSGGGSSSKNSNRRIKQNYQSIYDQEQKNDPNSIEVGSGGSAGMYLSPFDYVCANDCGFSGFTILFSSLY
jgi:hypothetical protein